MCSAHPNSRSTRKTEQDTHETDREQQSPPTDSPYSRCTYNFITYTCGHHTTVEIRDALCPVCIAQHSFCNPVSICTARVGTCFKCVERVERDKEEGAKVARVAEKTG